VERVDPSDQDAGEAYMIATIALGRSALELLEDEFGTGPGFEAWWRSLEGDNPTLRFFRDERNAFLHGRSVNAERRNVTIRLPETDVSADSFSSIAGVGPSSESSGADGGLPGAGEPVQPEGNVVTLTALFFKESPYDQPPAVEVLRGYLHTLDRLLTEAGGRF
jgi:hypothetical protein